MKRNIIPGRSITAILALSVGALSLSFISSAFADTTNISSTSFSLGYGATANAVQSLQWTTTETAGSNTNVTSPFTLAVVFSSRTPSGDGDNSYDGAGSLQGPTFPDRVLSNGDTTTTISGWSPRFQVTLNGAYTGPTPPDAAATPNYQLTIDVTSIRIYGNVSAYGDASHHSMWFTETTSGHGSSMSPALVSLSNPILAATNWTQIAWNPNDFSTNGTTSSRTFVIDADTTASTADHGFIDGFEVFGNLVLTYDAIPEPATMGFFGVGALWLIRRRRMR